MSCADSSKWGEAILKEINSLESNGTFETVDIPRGQKLIRSKWTFNVKANADGSVASWKARMVGKGFSQKAHIDYDETFAPV
jgi:predicted secreted protein